MTQTYIPIPFGQDADDLADIPFETVDDGSVSYQQGFGPRYQLKLRVNPSALPFPRGQFNQLMLTMTQNQQSWMQYGLTLWTAAADNLGVALAYPINAIVYYNAQIYRNTVAGNVATPGTDDTWVIGAESSLVGSSMIWNSIENPVGRWFEEDGSAISRTTYGALYNVICPVKVGDTANTSDMITGLTNALRIKIGSKVEAAGITAGSTVIAVPNDTSVQISIAATATATDINIRFFTWGNGDGSTTFNIPKKSEHYLAFAGGTGITYDGNTYNRVGQTLGAATYQIVKDNLPEHTHNPYAGSGTFIGSNLSGTVEYSTGGARLSYDPVTGGITGGTTNDPIPTVPPGVMVRSFIRY